MSTNGRSASTIINGLVSFSSQTNSLSVVTGLPTVVTLTANAGSIPATGLTSSTPPGGPSAATTRSSSSTSPSQPAIASSGTRLTSLAVSAGSVNTDTRLTSQRPSTFSTTSFQPSTSSRSSITSTSLPPSSSSISSPQPSPSGLTTGAKAGIGIGAVLAALIIAAAAYYLGKRAKGKKPPVESHEPQYAQVMYEGLDRKDTVRHELQERQAPMPELPGWPRQAQRAELPDREKGTG